MKHISRKRRWCASPSLRVINRPALPVMDTENVMLTHIEIGYFVIFLSAYVGLHLALNRILEQIKRANQLLHIIAEEVTLTRNNFGPDASTEHVFSHMDDRKRKNDILWRLKG